MADDYRQEGENADNPAESGVRPIMIIPDTSSANIGEMPDILGIPPSPVRTGLDVKMNIYVCFDSEVMLEERADWLETCRMMITSIISHQNFRRQVDAQSVSVVLHEAPLDKIKAISMANGYKWVREQIDSTLPYTFTVAIKPYDEKKNELMVQAMRFVLAGKCSNNSALFYKKSVFEGVIYH